MVCTLIPNGMHHHSDHNVMDSRGAASTITSTVQLLQTVKEELLSFCDKTYILAYKMVLPWKKHFQSLKKNTLQDTLTQAAQCGLLYNSKLANQIVTLVAIAVKYFADLVGGRAIFFILKVRDD